MILKVADWRFRVDVEATRERTTQNTLDHCECGYCRNYYDTIARTFPQLCTVLGEFGVNIEGPSELMPFEPTLMLACYRVQGEIVHWGKAELFADGISIIPEASDNGTFLLWVGEMELPWVQKERAEDVVSPANLPEFLERMREVWLMRHGNEFVFS